MIPYGGMLSKGHCNNLTKRLNLIRGQVAGIKKMVEEPRYCVDILTQIAAVRSALDSAAKIILKDHLKTCVRSAILRGRGEREINELTEVIGKFK